MPDTSTSEVERLRARVVKLESERAAAARPTSPTARGGGWWAVASAVLIVVACCLALVSVASVRLSAELSDTERYVETVAHTQVVALLEGNEGGVVRAQNDQITLNQAPIIAAVKDRLVDRGFELAASIPEVDRTFVLAESDSVTRAQGLYRALNTLGVWLPAVTLALLVLGIVLARDRRRALVRGALGVAASMLVLGVVIALARVYHVQTTPAGVLDASAAGGVFDAVVRFLRTSLRALGVAALVVAVAGLLAGPSPAAVRTRATFERGIGSARSGADRAGWSTGPVGRWVFAHVRRLRVLTVVGAGLLLMFWTEPTGWVVVWIAVGGALVLALVQFLGAPPGQDDAVPVPAGHADAGGLR